MRTPFNFHTFPTPPPSPLNIAPISPLLILTPTPGVVVSSGETFDLRRLTL